MVDFRRTPLLSWVGTRTKEEGVAWGGGWEGCEDLIGTGGLVGCLSGEKRQRDMKTLAVRITRGRRGQRI